MSKEKLDLLHPNVDKSRVGDMFNSIASHYDFLNHLLSLGIDIYWRNRLAKLCEPEQNTDYLDIASGTGDQLFAVCKRYQHLIRRATGIDIAIDMLALAKQKSARYPFAHKVELLHESALAMPFDNLSFDLITISFGIRNLPDIERGLAEMYRVLKPGGQLAVLEFSLPYHPLIRKGHLFYLRFILPWVGRLFSRNREAYTYLNKTIEEFPYGKNFSRLLKARGFQEITDTPLSCGIVTIYRCKKPEANEV